MGWQGYVDAVWDELKRLLLGWAVRLLWGLAVPWIEQGWSTGLIARIRSDLRAEVPMMLSSVLDIPLRHLEFKHLEFKMGEGRRSEPVMGETDTLLTILHDCKKHYF
jgi:hypothetical protein